MGKRTYSEETKAAAMAALLTGQSVASVAREYKIPVGTVKAWKSREANDGVATPKKERIGELLVEYLDATLRALRAQAELFADRKWLAKQEASQLAVLHGVQTDKAVRLLEAMGGPDDAGDAS